jgi:hypothetical protein
MPHDVKIALIVILAYCLVFWFLSVLDMTPLLGNSDVRRSSRSSDELDDGANEE